MKSSNFRYTNIEALLYKWLSLTTLLKVDHKNPWLRFIVIFVADFSEEELEDFKNRTLDRYQSTPIKVEFYFYTLKNLKEKFGIEE